MPLERRKIERALLRKGFIRKEGDHHYFHHRYHGKETGFYASTSHGTGYKTYDDSLLGPMKRQLGLDYVSQLKKLVECPISAADYIQLLREKGLLSD